MSVENTAQRLSGMLVPSPHDVFSSARPRCLCSQLPTAPAPLKPVEAVGALVCTPTLSLKRLFPMNLMAGVADGTFHRDAGRGVHTALGVADTAQVEASVLFSHPLNAQPLVGICQVNA